MGWGSGPPPPHSLFWVLWGQAWLCAPPRPSQPVIPPREGQFPPPSPGWDFPWEMGNMELLPVPFPSPNPTLGWGFPCLEKEKKKPKHPLGVCVLGESPPFSLSSPPCGRKDTGNVSPGPGGDQQPDSARPSSSGKPGTARWPGHPLGDKSGVGRECLSPPQCPHTGQRTLHHRGDVLETLVLLNPSDKSLCDEVSSCCCGIPGIVPRMSPACPWRVPNPSVCLQPLCVSPPAEEPHHRRVSAQAAGVCGALRGGHRGADAADWLLLPQGFHPDLHG